MKKIIAMLFATACLLSFNIANAQKNGGANGEWTISSISLEDNSMKDSLQNVPVFEDADINCLLNSTWDLSGSSGYYKISQESGCTKGTRQINWMRFNIKGSDFFQFYRTSAVHGVAADQHSIYICEISAAGKENFTLRYPILFADKPNAILFNFTRK